MSDTASQVYDKTAPFRGKVKEVVSNGVSKASEAYDSTKPLRQKIKTGVSKVYDSAVEGIEYTKDKADNVYAHFKSRRGDQYNVFIVNSDRPLE